MAIINDKIVVDFLPVIENNDSKKVFDHGLIKFNKIILSVFNQLNMQKGTLEDYPELGCLESLLDIHFSQSQVEQISVIRENIRIYQKETVNFDIIKDENDSKNVNISITVESVPNLKFVADMISNNNAVKIINPEIIEV